MVRRIMMRRVGVSGLVEDSGRGSVRVRVVVRATRIRARARVLRLRARVQGKSGLPGSLRQRIISISRRLNNRGGARERVHNYH